MAFFKRSTSFRTLKMATIFKYPQKVGLSNAFVFFFIFSSLSFAETKTFVEEYTYQASEADSKLSSRVIALEQVKRQLLEKLGTYLETETEINNYQLTKDQIITLSAGIVRTEIIDEKWDGKIYSLKAQITADPKDVANSLEKMHQDRNKIKRLEETRKKANEALGEVERLKKELETAKPGQREQDQYNEAINRLSATDWYDKGVALFSAGMVREAMEAYTKAIVLDPNLAIAYADRGAAYFLFGAAREAIKDFDKAIELDPKDWAAYYNRGGAYGNLEDYRQATKDYDKAIELNPNSGMAHSERGFTYFMLGDYPQAIRDFDRGIALDPKYARAYALRGAAYLNLRDYRQAIRDFDRAIALDSKDASAYNFRGGAYLNLGDYQRGIEDIKMAAKLGLKKAQDLLRELGVVWWLSCKGNS